MNNPTVKQVAFWLTVVGALNWGLVALFNLNLVTTLFSANSLLTTLVYLVIAASAVYVALPAVSGSKKKGRK